jgi:hypothetical protein
MTATLTSLDPIEGAAIDRHRRAIAAAILIVAAPVLRGLSIVIHPFDTDDASETLAMIDERAVQWAAAHLLEPIATLLLGVAGFLLLPLVPAVGRRLAWAGAVLFGIGSAGMALLVHAHGEAYLKMAHDSVDRADMVALYDQFHTGTPLAAPLVPAFFVGGVLLAAGLYLGGRVSRLAAAVFSVSTIVPNFIPQDDGLVLAGIVGSVPMVAVMTVFAIALVRNAEERTASQPAPAEVRTAAAER